MATTDSGKLVLYQFNPAKRFPNLSPFCVKLETYLKLANIPYECKYTVSTRLNPKAKMPYVKYKNEIIGDTSLIIERLKHDYGDKLDAQLTEKDKSVALAYKILVEDHLMPMTAYFLWIDPEGFNNFFNAVLKNRSWLVRNIFVGRMVRNVKKNLWGHGIGRHSRQEIIEFANQDIKAVAEFLDNKKYFLGDKISTVDCSIFAVIGVTLTSPSRSPLVDIIKKYPNLVQYVDRVLQEQYPQYPRVT